MATKSQVQRTRSLADFKRRKSDVLVATDVAARGIDIEDLSHVVNFDLPHVREDYVHRIGRAGAQEHPAKRCLSFALTKSNSCAISNA